MNKVTQVKDGVKIEFMFGTVVTLSFAEAEKLAFAILKIVEDCNWKESLNHT